MSEIDRPKNGIDAFKLYWAGKGKLTVAYWGYGVVGTLVIYFLAMTISLLLIPFAYKEGSSILESSIFINYLLGAYIFLVVYQVLVWVLVWRNAKNVTKKFWGHIAKAGVVGGVIMFLIQIVEKI